MAYILVVEDNEDNMDLVFAFLEDSFSLKGCDNGYDVISLFENDPQYVPDLILCDISLPGMDGVDLLQVIRNNKSWSHVPVVALTSHAMKGDREKFLEAGFDEYIAKPIIDEKMLYGPINKLLGR